MKNDNFSLGGSSSIDELNDLFQDMMESSGGFINDVMKLQDIDKLMARNISLSPDTYGCERLFIEFFINGEMGEDFLLIARDFYAHEFANIPAYEDGRTLYWANLSRILCVSKMYGIKIADDCNFAYGFLNEYSDQLILHDSFSFAEAAGDSFKDCQKEIEERFDKKKLYSLDTKMSKFLGNVLKWLGYSPKFADWCDENDRGLEDRLAITLSILKKTFSKSDKEYSAEELSLYGMILHCASAMTCNLDWMADALKILAYGEAGTFYYDEFPPMFQLLTRQIMFIFLLIPSAIQNTINL